MSAAPDRIRGRALSPRSFRAFGIEAVVLGPAVPQEGLLRREGVALWRRLPGHGALFDRVAGEAAEPAETTTAAEPDLLAVRVVVATTRVRARGLRVPVVGSRVGLALDAAAREPAGLPPTRGWLLLVDEGPGETWLYLAGDEQPAAALGDFVARRGRTDFARARRRSRLGGLGSLGAFAGLVLAVYAPLAGLGTAGRVAGGLLLVLSVAVLVAARPR